MRITVKKLRKMLTESTQDDMLNDLGVRDDEKQLLQDLIDDSYSADEAVDEWLADHPQYDVGSTGYDLSRAITASVTPSSFVPSNGYDLFGIGDLDDPGIESALLKAGWLISGQTMYNPNHWEPVPMGSGGDFWYYEDEFKALSQEARDYANREGMDLV